MLFENKKYREKRQRKRVFFVILSFFLVGIFLLIFLLYRPNTDNVVNVNINQENRILGKVIVDDNFPTYTHQIQIDKGLFPIKSSVFNLNDFNNKTIQVIGELNISQNGTEVVDVKKIKDYENVIAIFDKNYLFASDLLLFDFSQDKALIAQKEGNKINIILNGIELLSINSFICNKLSESQDCEGREKQLLKQGVDSFQSFYGNIFYNFTGDSWITFNDHNLGYIIEFSELNNLLNLSHIIHILDSNYIKKNYKSQLLKACQNKYVHTQTIDSIESRIESSGILLLEIIGIDDTHKQIECSIRIDIFDSRKISNVQLTEL